MALALASFGLGLLMLFGASKMFSGQFQGAVAANQNLVALIRSEAYMPFLVGILLIFWPLYLAWLEQKWKK